MASRAWIGSSIACAALFAAALPAQQNPPGSADIAGLPTARGIYYHAAPGWVALQSTLLVPFSDGGRVLEFLDLAPARNVAEMPGPHAAVQIGNTRPTFYLRGVAPAELYLVRGVAKADYRELRMPVSRDFQQWAHFRAQDVTGVETQQVAADVVTVKPRADLKPGEYALSPVLMSGDRWIRLGYDFGLTAGRTGP